jgi:hypothetical protein
VTTLLHFEPHSAPVTHVTSRIIFTIVVIAIIGLAIWGMRRAWLGKAKNFAHLPAPQTVVPAGSTALTPSVAARFAGSTAGGQWLNRITVHALGTPRGVVASVHSDGIFINDAGDFSLWLPKTALTGVRVARGIAGDVVEPEGMVILTWNLGEQSIDSGLRVNRNNDHEQFLKAARELVNGVSA